MNRTWSNCCSVWPKRWTDGFELGVQEGTRSVRQRGQVRLKWSQMILHCEVCCQADCNPHKSCCHNNMNTRSWWLHRYRDFFTVFLMQYAVLKREIILSNSFYVCKNGNFFQCVAKKKFWYFVGCSQKVLLGSTKKGNFLKRKELTFFVPFFLLRILAIHQNPFSFALAAFLFFFLSQL